MNSRVSRVLPLLLGLAACGPSAWEARDIIATTMGPLAIHTWIRKVSAGGFPNTSGNPFKTTEVSVFRITAAGEPVTAVDGDVTHDEFWDAWVLPDAPEPAVLAALTGVYLITASDDRVATRVIVESDGGGGSASLQWLDSRDGQPGDVLRIGISDNRDEPRRLQGGQLLLVNDRVVLDVTTLQAQPLRWWLSAAQLDEYNPSNSDVKALSPGRTQVVLLGNRYRESRYEYALVVVEITTERAYALPFDQEATRMESHEDVTPAWLRHYFEWSADADGNELLQPRADVQPLPWLGRLVEFGGDMVEYHLARARPGLTAVLQSFLEERFGARTAAGPGSDTTLEIEGNAFVLGYRPDKAELVLYAASGAQGTSAAAYATVRRIAATFDAELAAGRHQEHFGTPQGGQ